MSRPTVLVVLLAVASSPVAFADTESWTFFDAAGDDATGLAAGGRVPLACHEPATDILTLGVAREGDDVAFHVTTAGGVHALQCAAGAVVDPAGPGAGVIVLGAFQSAAADEPGILLVDIVASDTADGLEVCTTLTLDDLYGTLLTTCEPDVRDGDYTWRIPLVSEHYRDMRDRAAFSPEVFTWTAYGDGRLATSDGIARVHTCWGEDC